MFTIVYVLIMFKTYLFAPTGYDCQTHENVEIVAHRGGAGMAPENSLTCIEKGIAIREKESQAVNIFWAMVIPLAEGVIRK